MNDQIPVIKAGFFRVLGHPARVRILEALRDGDKTVGELQALLKLDSSGTSQHLAALKQQGIVAGNKQGTTVRYSVRDPRIFELLEIARIVILSHLSDATALMKDLSVSELAPSGGTEGGPPR